MKFIYFSMLCIAFLSGKKLTFITKYKSEKIILDTQARTFEYFLNSEGGSSKYSSGHMEKSGDNKFILNSAYKLNELGANVSKKMDKNIPGKMLVFNFGNDKDISATIKAHQISLENVTKSIMYGADSIFYNDAEFISDKEYKKDYYPSIYCKINTEIIPLFSDTLFWDKKIDSIQIIGHLFGIKTKVIYINDSFNFFTFKVPILTSFQSYSTITNDTVEFLSNSEQLLYIDNNKSRKIIYEKER